MNKSIFCMLVGFALCGSVMAAGFSGGTGTQNDPYLIATPQDLVNINSDPYNYNKYYWLTADIDMTGISTFHPIGTLANKFSGKFNGNGFTISSVTFNTVGVSYIGIFGNINTLGQVWNLKVSAMTVTAQEGTYIAAIAGFNSGVILGCEVSSSSIVSTINGKSSIGGIAGYNNGQIRECTVKGTVVSGQSSIGGIAGTNQDGYIYHCTVDAATTVSGGDFVGGIAGTQDQGGEIASCTSAATVNGVQSVGAIAGLSSFSLIADCSATGFVNGSLYTGGIVGYNWSGQVTGSTTRARVTGGNYAGGIAGYNKSGTIRTTTAYNIVTGDENVSQFVGENNGGVFDIAQSPFNMADLNQDGIVDDLDVVLLAADWLQSGLDLIGDINADETVDLVDFIYMANNWLVITVID